MNKPRGRIPKTAQDYPVGYGKPPAHSQFKAGRSGNPNGRPKGAKGVRALVNGVLDETVRIAENGQPRAIQKRRAILMAMIAKAIKGDVRAADLIVKLMQTHDPKPPTDASGRTHEDWLELLK
jgi:hypothetical protein